MGAMHAFLEQLETPQVRALYRNLDEVWDGRADALNRRLADEGLPVRVANLQTIWTVSYTQPSRYNWMLQYYLRAEGLALSWVGTGRFIFSLNYREADFQIVADKIVAAARAMKNDAFWWSSPALTNKAIKRQVLRELIRQRL
jgi:glutamate-1-semialdehyde 2,1-aminomutase